jgi:predicted N-acyltransferase
MSYQIITVGEDMAEAWNKLARAKGTPFHSFEWRRVLEKTYGYEPLYLAAISDGGLKGILPSFIQGKLGWKRIVSLPMADYGGTIAEGEDIDTLLLEKLKEYAGERGLKQIEINMMKKPGELPDGFYITTSSCTFILDTKRPFADVWAKSFNHKTRNKVWKSQKEGVLVKQGDSISDLDDYYNLYVRTMRKLATLPRPQSFFNEICLQLSDYKRLFIAMYQGKAIAGKFVFIFNKKMHFWGAVSDERFLSLAPNNALYSYAIQWACEHNLDCVDFGRTAPDSPHFLFKKHWGGREIPLYTITTSLNPITQPEKLLNIARPILRHMPVPLAKFAGSIAYRYY